MNIIEISPEKANKLFSEGALLLDVRENDEVLQTSFQVDEIIYIPYSIFDNNYLQIPKNRKIVLACHVGIRSLRIAQFLVIQGWDGENIYNLAGGIKAWQAAGLPVKKAPRTFSFVKSSSCGCGKDSCC